MFLYNRFNQIINTGNPNTYYEDPFLWTDSRNMWHILMHAYNTKEDRAECNNSKVSARLYSQDGYQWRVSQDWPYTTQILVKHVTGLTNITVSTRERPKLLFSPAGTLTQAWDYTLVTSLEN